ncbi:MAG: carboxypeptidase regulatory-like domain-containing protein [Candidatus Thiodiazotropha sp. (ex Lucinoma kastoroae)]|nr:carboxypeptidase regulatory-like domain-containing protein [Candidatus Thiodiazotropha sp. (ex Lucinoma kastoroae)]
MPILKSTSLGDRVWEDTNANGIQDDGENGIPDVTVRLYTCLSDGSTGTLVTTTTTDANGNYLFPDLAPGTYKVEFVAPNGYVYSTQDATVDSADSDADANGLTGCYTLDPGEHDTSADAGLYQTASLGDYVWVDTDEDGQQNETNTGLNGVTVNLKDGLGMVISSTVTANDNNGNAGYYLFDGLIPGDYSVEFIKPADYNFTRQDQGDEASDSDVDQATGMTVTTTLTSGENDLSWDAGLVQVKASLGDKVWYDADADGLQDANEMGIAGVTVTLKGGGTDGVLGTADDTTETTTTNAAGNYLFDNLNAGEEYKVIFSDTPDGYEYTTPNVNGNSQDSIDSDAVPMVADNTDMILEMLFDNANLDSSTSGNNHSGSVVGDPVFANGMMTLDGNGDGIKISKTGSLNDNTPERTIHIRFKADDVNGTQVLYEEGGSWRGMNVYIDAGNLYLGGWSGNNSSTVGTYLSTDIVAGAWYDVSLVLDAGASVTPDGLKGYLNGVEFGSADITQIGSHGNGSGIGIVNAGTKLHTGNTNGQNAFAGMIDDVRVYDRALSEDEVTSLAGDIAMTQTVTLAPGEHNPTLDAGLYQTASLGDYVWVDTDEDGQQNDGNTGLNGVTVNLKDSNGDIVATTVTADDSNGNAGYYLFDGLIPGDYSVGFVKLAGYDFTTQDQGGDASDSDANQATGMTATTTLTSGENDLSWDAGLVQVKASLGDRVWEDTDADGVQDNGENGIPDVTVRLYTCLSDGSTGALVTTTTTDTNGNYLFPDLAPGTYKVEFVAPNGYVYSTQDATVDSADSDADANGLTGCYTLDPGEHDTSADAGLYQTASLGDYVWVDTNEDGQQNDGNTGLNGVTVNLKDSNGDIVATTVTADDSNGNAGYYLFDGLIPGDYSVGFVKPAGYDFTTQDQGGDASDSDANQATGMTATTTLTSGENDLSWDAGLVQVKASLGDRIWYDTNENGRQDSGEGGVAGVTIDLRNQVNGTILATTVTDNSGNYLFDNLDAGYYAVDIRESTLPTDYEFTTSNATTDTLDSDADSLGRMALTYLSAGENDLSWDAGIVKKAAPLGKIGDRIWYDANGNGRQDLDLNEGGVAGVTIDLRNQVNGSILATTTTNSMGNYLFDNLDAGYYAVDVRESTLPTGYEFTTRNATSDNLDSDADSAGRMYTTYLSAGETDRTHDAGIVKPAPVLGSIGDRVWHDRDRDGYQDYDEPGIQGVGVSLWKQYSNGYQEYVATTSTDHYGNYHFGNLEAGTYQIWVNGSSLPLQGYYFTRQNAANDNYDSDVDGIGQSGWFQLSAGEHDNSWDAGAYYCPIAVDLNGDGIQTLGLDVGVTFDMDNDGAVENTGWLSGDDAFIVNDANGNGIIDDRSEMFGGDNTGDGFRKLAEYDSNGDGVVDTSDAAFDQLQVWQDRNENGLTDEGELGSLADAGIASLDVRFETRVEGDETNDNGNRLLDWSSAETAEGDSVDLVDVYFAKETVDLSGVAELTQEQSAGGSDGLELAADDQLDFAYDAGPSSIVDDVEIPEIVMVGSADDQYVI